MKRCNNRVYHGYDRFPLIEPLILTRVSPNNFELVSHVPNVDNVRSTDFCLQNVLKLPSQDLKQANIGDNFESSSSKIHSVLADIENNYLEPTPVPTSELTPEPTPEPSK